MKRLVPIIMIISTSLLTAQHIELKLLESPEGSAECVNSEAEYLKLRTRDREGTPVITVAPPFYDSRHPWIRSNVAHDKKIGQKLAEQANKWHAQSVRAVNINGRRTNVFNDCCHFVRAIYWHVAGIDILYEPIRNGSAKKLGVDMRSGCAIVWSHMKEKERTNRTPRIGDVIFFDNTWDRNRNRRWDDPYTHVGIVTEIAKDDTVTFIHANTGRPKRVRKAYLNMKYPGDRRRNTYLQARYRWDRHPKNLAGQITRVFGGFSFASSKREDPGKKKVDPGKIDPAKKDTGTKISGAWKLKWKNKGGVYSYMFRETVLTLNADGTAVHKEGMKTEQGTWKKQGDSIVLYIKGKIKEKYRIIRINEKELFVSIKGRYQRRTELLFNKK